MVVCLGDFFDKPQLSSQELTALREINWSSLRHFFLVGNHESEQNDLQFSSTMALAIGDNFSIISNPTELDLYGTSLCFLPYITEYDRQPLSSYFDNKSKKHRILFSHNDLCGIQMGPVISRTGFNTDEFADVCDICLNGHLHNGQKINDVVINLGNLTGRDFGEDATKYTHKIAIIDTEELTVKYEENPYAFNFYKIDINNEADLTIFDKLKNNAVLSIKCDKNFIETVKKLLTSHADKIVDSRIITVYNYNKVAEGDCVADISDLVVDHHTKFAECCIEHLGDTPIVTAELSEILK